MHMDSSSIARLFFRRFYTYCTLSSKSLHSGEAGIPVAGSFAPSHRYQGTYSKLRREAEERKQNEEKSQRWITRADVDRASWQRRKDEVPPEVAKELNDYESVTSEKMRTRDRKPKRVKMLMRDFIEGTPIM